MWYNKLKLAAALMIPVLFICAGVIPSEDTKSFFMIFTGMMTDKPVAANMVGREVINADIIVRGGLPILKQRAGFTKLGGSGLDSDAPVSGIFEYVPTIGEPRLAIVSGKRVMVYNAELDTFYNLVYDPTVATCTLEQGSDTVRGVANLFWWELSHRAFTHLVLGDGDADEDSVLVKGWLFGRYAILDTAFDEGDYDIEAAYEIDATHWVLACTLAGTDAGIVAGFEDVFNDPYVLKSGLNFMDTLVIVGPNKRVKWAPVAQPVIASSPEMTGIRDRPFSRRSGAWMQFEGPDIANLTRVAPGGDWVQFELNNTVLNTTDTTRYLNRAYCLLGRTYTGSPSIYTFYADSIDREYFANDSDSLWKVKRLGSENQGNITWTRITALNCQIDSCIVDSHIDKWLGFRTVILSTTVADFPRTWDADTLDTKTWVTGWNYRSKTWDWKHWCPVTFFRENDSTKISIYERLSRQGGFHPYDDVLRDADSLVFWELDKESAKIDVDTVSHITWTYPLQALLNSRLYYSGDVNDPSLLYWMEEYTLGADTSDYDGSVYVNRNDGDRITAIIAHKRDLIVAKERSLYYCLVSPYDNEIEEIVRLESITGVSGQNAVAKYMDMIFFVSPPQGVFMFDGMELKSISAPVHTYIQDSISSDNMSAVNVVVYQDPNLGTPGLYIAYVDAYDAVNSDEYWNNRILRYDIVTGQWTKYTNMSVSCFAEPSGSYIFRDTLLFGTTNDYMAEAAQLFVMKFPAGVDDTGQDITMSYLSTQTAFDNPLVRKRVFTYLPQFKSTAVSNSWTTTWYTDWSNTAKETDQFTPANGWQMPRRVVDSVLGQSVGIKLQSTGVDTTEISGVQIYYREQGPIR